MKIDRYGTGVLSKDIPEERSRLELLQDALDPLSIAAIDRTAITGSPKCLDLGAGAGSVSRWLSQRFPDGEIFAADIDPRYLAENTHPNVSVLNFDMRTDGFPDSSFDLIHTRSVLKHLPEREEILGRIHNWLKPGAWLVLIDGYWFPSDDTAHPIWSAPMSAIVEQMNSQGGDMCWTRKLPGLVARLGFVDVSVQLAPSLGGWNGWGRQNHDWIKPTIRQTAPTLVEKGYISQADIDDYLSRPDEPDMAEWFGIVAAIVCRRALA